MKGKRIHIAVAKSTSTSFEPGTLLFWAMPIDLNNGPLAIWYPATCRWFYDLNQIKRFFNDTFILNLHRRLTAQDTCYREHPGEVYTLGVKRCGKLFFEKFLKNRKP